MLGTAALAMWWDMAPGIRDEFEHWHSHEHFLERLALPGFQRASRWAEASGGESFFVLYELATYEALFSPEYVARLNAPSEWSRKMMPHHRNMVRSPCRVLESRGSTVAACALTVRFEPAAGAHETLRGHLRELVEQLPSVRGLAGAHLLQTDAPPMATTTEQRMRGLADRTADWIFIATGYDGLALHRLLEGVLSPAALRKAGTQNAAIGAAYTLRLSLDAAESA